MPRIAPRSMAQASRVHPLLGKLMGVCRTVDAAKRELRWLEDEILKLDERDSFRLLQKYRIPFQPLPSHAFSAGYRGKWERLLLQKFIAQRSKGTPLSLVVENQPFGYLNIHVHPGCFIPRWETEEWTLALASRLRRLAPSQQPYTVVDLCTGSGCIPLLLKDYISADIDPSLHSTYGNPNTNARFIGIEKSASAIKAARINLRNLRGSEQGYPDTSIYFIHRDMFQLPFASFQGRVDIITCNPPYIPLSSRPTVDVSVTKYEPSESLFVPSEHGDNYYYNLRDIADLWETPVLVMEVGGTPQAERIRSLYQSNGWKSSIWHDSAGHGRVVVAVRLKEWDFLLPQPDYSIPLDLSPFPRKERPRRAPIGSLISTFRRPKVIVRENSREIVKEEKETSEKDICADSDTNEKLGVK